MWVLLMLAGFVKPIMQTVTTSSILRNQKRSKASTALGPTGFNAEFHKENSLLD